MRRLVSLAVALCLLAVLAAPAAAGGKPQKTNIGPTILTADDLAGTCDFPVQVVDTFASSSEFVYPTRANGDQLVKYTGGFRSVVTNLDTGSSIDVTYFGRLTYLFKTDGTVDVSLGGKALFWTTADDTLSSIGQGLWMIIGHMTTTLDAETFLVLEPEQLKGRVVDLCAALS